MHLKHVKELFHCVGVNNSCINAWRLSCANSIVGHHTLKYHTIVGKEKNFARLLNSITPRLLKMYQFGGCLFVTIFKRLLKTFSDSDSSGGHLIQNRNMQ